MSIFGLFSGCGTKECCSKKDQGLNNPKVGEIPSPGEMKQLILDSKHNNSYKIESDQQGQEYCLEEMANQREQKSLRAFQDNDSHNKPSDGCFEIAPIFKVPQLGSSLGFNEQENDFCPQLEEGINDSLKQSNHSCSHYQSSSKKQMISENISIPITIKTKKNYDDRLHGAPSGNQQAESTGENDNSNSNSNTPRQNNATYKASIRSRNSSQHSLEGGSHQSKQHKRNTKAWTEEEDRLLRFYYSKHNGKWPAIANEMADRNAAQCSQRWRRIKPSKIRRPWTPEEDVIVMQLINQHGKNWGLISSNMDNRSGKQVRERYINKLDPSLNNDQFTEEEDKIIINKYYKIGPKWSEIAKYLHGRSENMVKNRFYSFIKKTYAISSLQGGHSETGSQCDSGYSSRMPSQEDKSSSYASSNYNELEPSVGSGNIESEDSSSENEYQQMSLGPNINNPSFVPQQGDLNNINNNINNNNKQQQISNIINYTNNNYDLSLQGFNSTQQPQNQQVQDPYGKKTNSWGKIEKADEMFHTPRLALANNSSFFPTEMFFQQQKIQEEVQNGQQQQQQQQQQQIQQSQQQYPQQPTPIETNTAFFQANPSPLLLLSPAQLKTDQFSFTSNTPNRRFLLSNSNTPYQQHSTYPNPSTNNSLNTNPLSSFAFNTAGSNNPNNNNNHFNFNNIASTPVNKNSNQTNAINQINQQFNQQQQQQLAAFNSYQNQQQQQQQQQQQPIDQSGGIFRFPNSSNSNCTTPQQNGINLKTAIEEPFENLNLNSNVQGGQFYVQPIQTAQPFLNDYQQQIYQQQTAQNQQPFQSNDFQNTFPQQYNQQQQTTIQYAQPQGRGIISQSNNTNNNNSNNNNAVQFILNSSTNQFNNQIYSNNSNNNNNFFNNPNNTFSNCNNTQNSANNPITNNINNNNSYQIINQQSKSDQGALNPREDLRIDISCARKQDEPPPLASATPKINRKQLSSLIVDLEAQLQLLKVKQQNFNDEDSDC